MSEQTAVAKKETATTFIPFGGKDEIKLTTAMVKSIIAVPTKSKKYPTDADCIKFIALCKARRLNPFEGDAFLIGYDTRNDGPKFSLITAQQAFLKRAESSDDFDGMESGIIVKRGDDIMDLPGDFYLPGDTLLGGWATVHFKNKKFPMHKRVRLQRFQKDFGIWQEDPAGMICKCAEADALRTSFPTIIGGMYLKEELEKKEETTSEPLFTGPSIEVESEPVEEEGIKITAASLRELCKQDGITEAVLLEFLESIALCTKDCKSVDKLSQESIAKTIAQWDDFSERMREVPED